jgi:hypothetical protein
MAIRRLGTPALFDCFQPRPTFCTQTRKLDILRLAGDLQVIKDIDDKPHMDTCRDGLRTAVKPATKQRQLNSVGMGVGSAVCGQLGKECPHVLAHDVGVLHGDEVAAAWEDGVAPQVGEVALGQLPGRDRPGVLGRHS